MSNSKSVEDAMRNAWTSERLIYRALEDGDADRAFFHETVAGDSTGFALGFLEALRPQSRSLSDAMFEELKKKGLSVVICLRGDASPEAGHIGDQPRPESPPSKKVPIGILTLSAGVPENHHHRGTTLGIIIIESYQGQGYGPEAINWALDWAFRIGGMHRVGLLCWGYNDKAQRLYERLGFVKEGNTREALWFNRTWYDAVNYGILESEWEKIRSQQGAGEAA